MLTNLNRFSAGGVPHMAFPALAQFARERPDHARALLGGVEVSPHRFGRRLILHFDRLIRGTHRNSELLSTVRACQAALTGDCRDQLLHAVTADAEEASRQRIRVGRLRSLWGTSPILNIVPAAQADRLLGVEAETVVITAYHITRDFDVVLKEQQEWVYGTAPELHGAYFWMVFLWALVSYDVFFYFNDRGLLLPTGGYGSERFGINLEEMRLLNRAHKRFYAVAYGADYRLREKTLASGKFNFCMHCPEVGRFCLCDDAGGAKVLETISTHATAMLGSGLSLDYLPNPRNLHYLVLDVKRFKPRYPEPRHGRPLRILHAPNHPHFKGTHYLEAAVTRLRSAGEAVELILLTGMSNREVLASMQEADVVVDQLIGGSFGYFAVEGMAFGKPVVCYIKDPSRVADPASFPIINADPDTIYDTLLSLLSRPDELAAIGRRSRQYVERYQSVGAFAARLRSLYLETAALPPEMLDSLSTQPGRRVRLERGVRHILRRTSHRAKALVRPARRRAYPVVRKLRRNLKTLRWLAVEWLAKSLRKCQQILRACSAWVWHSGPLPLAIGLGRLATRWRSRTGTLRSMWGITPILTLPLLARCDRELGIESASLVFTTYHVHGEFDINLKRVTDWVLGHVPFLHGTFRRMALAYALVRFDIFHLFCDQGILPPAARMGINPAELDILRRAGKRIYTYTYGADVRTRGRTVAALPGFNCCMDCPEPGKYCVCDDALGQNNMEEISRRATAMLAMGDMTLYVPGCRDLSFWPIDVEKLGCVGVDPPRGRPLRIAHAPNHPHFKGTRYLVDAVERLRSEGVAIELVTVTGVPNSEVIRIFGEADVIADQFIIGMYGYTALEGMARGKAVLCHIAVPEWLVAQEECPLIRCRADTLYDVLRELASNPGRLEEIGRQGRRYIEKHHSLDAVAARLGRLYLETADLAPAIRARLGGRVAELEEKLARLPGTSRDAESRTPGSGAHLAQAVSNA